MLTNLGAAAGVTGELFHTPMGAAFADLTIDGQRQTWAIRSKTFRAWLRRSHYETTGTALGGASYRASRFTNLKRKAPHEDRRGKSLTQE
jgi:hypothetical protein